jgi:hypothetical protein
MVNLKLYIGLRMMRMIPVAVFALLLLLLSLTSATATATTVSVVSAAITEGGSTIIPLQIENAATEISCATILLSYDSTIARVTEVSNGDFDKLVYNADDAQGQTTLVVYQTGASGLSGTIKIGDLTLAGINAGTTSLVPQITTLKDNGGISISADVAIGTFTVRSAGGSGGSSGGSSGGGGTSTPSPTPTPSTMPSTSPSLTSTPSSVSATAIPSPSGSAESGFITVHIAAVRAGKGDEVTVPIMISDVSGEGLSSARITLTYDPKVVNVLNAENSDFDEFVSNIENGMVRMIGFQTGLEGLTGDVTFAQLHLKAVGREGTTSALGLEVQELVDNRGPLLVEHNDYEVQAGSFAVGSAGEPEMVSESLNSLVFVIGIVGMLLAVIIGFYLFVLLKRRSS